MSLAKLVAPHSVDAFMSDFFERGHLHIRRDSKDYFADLSADLNLKQNIWRCGGAWGQVSLARAATSPSENIYAASKSSVDNIEAAFADGYTIVLNNVQDQSLAAAAFCREIEKYFLFRCNANAYLTDAHRRGLDAHYDDQDVFVLQLAGMKIWRVFEGGPILPLEEQPYACPDIGLLPFIELRMLPGDVLYLPRGFIHDARTEDAQSLHLTISVSALRQSALLQNAVQHLAERDAGLRRSIPPQRMHSAAGMEGELSRLNAALSRLSTADLQQGIAGFQDRLLHAITRLPAEESFKEHPPALGVSTTVTIPDDQICLMIPAADSHILKFIGGQVEISEELYQSASFISNRRRFLVEQIPGPLSAAQKVAFAEFLMGLGILEIVAD